MSSKNLLTAALVALLTLGPATACSDDAGPSKTTDSSTTSAGTTSTDTDTDTDTDTTEPPDDDQPGESVAQEVGSDADFYTVPEPLPGDRHGQLLRFQQVEPSLHPDSTTWRIMYRSESVAGDPIAVTGVAVVPDGEAPAQGRRLLTLSHGTTGIADECAPSKNPGSELILMGPAVEAGWLVAMTDFEGLGTPGRHPYLVGESEGRSTIDAILAAAELPGAEAGDQLAIAGYSQGGHGALWANEVAQRWAPELQVVGTFAGAPATELDVILGAAPHLPVAGFAYMIVAGFGAAYDEADPALFLTPAGLDELDIVDEVCGGQIIANFAGTAPGDLVLAEGPASDPWKRLAAENNPGQVRTDAPILIIHSAKDQVVPAVLSEILLARMCSNDQIVERRLLPEGGHVDAAIGAYADSLEWLTDRFDESSEPVNSCSA